MNRVLQIIVHGALAALALAAEPVVPEAVQFPLLAKALTFDHNLAERCGERVTLCVLYQPSVKASRQCRANFEAAAAASGIGTISGLPLDVVYLVYDVDNAWQDSAALVDADVLYVTPVAELAFGVIRDFASSQKVLTVGSLPQHVFGGLSLGFTVEDAKPKMLIDLESSKDEGVAFSAQLLKLAMIHNSP